MGACKTCGAAWNAEAFYASSKGRCKECVRAKARQYRADNIERVREYDRQRSDMPHRVALRKQVAAARKLAPDTKEYDRTRTKAWQERNAEKRKAHIAVGNGLRDGKLKRWPCQRCGTVEGVQAHHDDYSRPFDVMWLCPTHHGERHRELNEMRRQREKAA